MHPVSTLTRRVLVQRPTVTPHGALITLSQISRRTLSSSLAVQHSRSSFVVNPSPPQLPPEEQKEFEELVRNAQMPLAGTSASVDALANVHPDARKPIEPEFEGDVNPVTGEIGGPKREPVRHGDWSFKGKVTDF